MLGAETSVPPAESRKDKASLVPPEPSITFKKRTTSPAEDTRPRMAKPPDSVVASYGSLKLKLAQPFRTSIELESTRNPTPSCTQYPVSAKANTENTVLATAFWAEELKGLKGSLLPQEALLNAAANNAHDIVRRLLRKNDVFICESLLYKKAAKDSGIT
jgi:hypothetical protein